MKIFVSFLIAAILIGFALFAILYWLFKLELTVAITSGFSGSFAGFVIDYLKERRKRNLKDIEA